MTVEATVTDSATRSCPACGEPWTGPARYNAVCGQCYRLAECSHGRSVRGYNTSFAGGFEARHTDDQGLCEQVTRDGRVTVRGLACRMGEARIGGVYVEPLG